MPNLIATRSRIAGDLNYGHYHVLMLGAGIQSTALFLLSREPFSRLKFDFAIFADTGEEPKAVYKHLEWLQSLGTPKILIRSTGKRLGDDILHNRAGRITSIPAFTAENHQTRPCENRLPPKPNGILLRQCTYAYKIAVCDLSIRRDVVGLEKGEGFPNYVHVWQYFGITTDERKRADKAKERFSTSKWTSAVYPFLDINWSRQDCINWLKDKVPHQVPRSACVFCPYRHNTDWQDIKENDPEGWARAVEIDNGLRTRKEDMKMRDSDSLYLHRSLIPLEMVDFKHSHTVFRPLENECQGMCGV